MNIINIGGWYVGNTAILDWMDGFEELAFVKGDFDIMRLENGIMDIIACQNLKKKLSMVHLQKTECYKGFYRIIRSFVGRYTKNFFKPTNTGSYSSHFAFHNTLISFLNKYEEQLMNNVEFDELEFWKKWLQTLTMLGSSKKNFHSTVYQNPFFYDETYDGHKNIWPELFAPYKLIFVHRDPLDQFSDIVNNGAHLVSSWPRFHGGTETMHPADRFLTISKRLYNARLRMADNYSKDELVIFSFEEFLQEHGHITGKLKLFLGIKSERDLNNKRFVREQSLINIDKGKHNKEALRLLEKKAYVLDDLNELRAKLTNHPNAF